MSNAWSAERLARLHRAMARHVESGEVAGLVTLVSRRDETRGKPPRVESGSGGLVSTADDYFAFCRMLLGRGEANGRRMMDSPTPPGVFADFWTATYQALGD
jgi:CubicO group peptidase (beta-lactamase class C family)